VNVFAMVLILPTVLINANKVICNFEKIVMLRSVTYLMGYAFTFTFASLEFPLRSICRIDCINRPGDLDL